MATVDERYPGRRVQYAALPYRVGQNGVVQVRLITSRETRRWVIPKGWPMKRLSPAKAAAREAYEEAGLTGTVAAEAIGTYTYEKNLGLRSVLCDVLVFPLKVKRHLQKWPEQAQRFGVWFSIDDAAAAVQEEQLKELILSFGALMAARIEAKHKAKEEARAAAAQKKRMDKARTKTARRSGGAAAPGDGAEAGASAAAPATATRHSVQGAAGKRKQTSATARDQDDASANGAQTPSTKTKSSKARSTKARSTKARADADAAREGDTSSVKACAAAAATTADMTVAARRKAGTKSVEVTKPADVAKAMKVRKSAKAAKAGDSAVSTAEASGKPSKKASSRKASATPEDQAATIHADGGTTKAPARKSGKKSGKSDKKIKP